MPGAARRSRSSRRPPSPRRPQGGRSVLERLVLQPPEILRVLICRHKAGRENTVAQLLGVQPHERRAGITAGPEEDTPFGHDVLEAAGPESTRQGTAETLIDTF